MECQRLFTRPITLGPAYFLPNFPQRRGGRKRGNITRWRKGRETRRTVSTKLDIVLLPGARVPSPTTHRVSAKEPTCTINGQPNRGSINSRALSVRNGMGRKMVKQTLNRHSSDSFRFLSCFLTVRRFKMERKREGGREGSRERERERRQTDRRQRERDREEKKRINERES